MSKPEAYCLILAGGGGTRLWPASRRKQPKQLLTLGGKESLLAGTFGRVGRILGNERTLIVTAADQVDAIRQDLPHLPLANLVVEPAARNTGPAVGLGVVEVARRAGQNAVVAVLPSDAYIGDETAFAEVMQTALEHAAETIVTLGLRPTRPETGYGYLQIGAPVRAGVFEVARFVEKPDATKAASYLTSGDYLWNSGMFFFTVARFLAEAHQHLPALAKILNEIKVAEDPLAVAARRYPEAPKISIDYGIMEKATGLRVVPGDFAWNDVGNWAAIRDIRPRDLAGNVTSGDVILSDVKNSVIMAMPGSPTVGVVGVDNVVVIVTRDAVLVVNQDRAQEVRTIVDTLSKAGRHELL
jgi:mannose-1-phosphate guanylyltransferase